MQLDWNALLHGSAASILFTLVGLAFFAFAFLVLRIVTPFSLRKEIEEDQNTALGVLIASVFIGVALVVSAATHGDTTSATVEATAPAGAAALSGAYFESLLSMVVSASIYALLGCVLFGFVFFIVTRITPFSIRKEIEEDHNMSLSIVLAAVNIGIGMVVAAAIKG